MNGTNKTLDRIGVLGLIFLVTATAGTATATAGQPMVRAVSGFESARTTDARSDLSDAAITVATPKTAGETTGKSATAAAETVTCCAHYVYSGYTELYDDFDDDGFYSFLRVNVDIDTDFVDSDLYVEVYLRGSTGGWLMIYESEVFTIHGTSAFDDYEVESELLSGFTPDYYDVLVEVYDAYSGDLVASHGPLENSAFALLPLEDVNRDGAIAPAVVASSGSSGGGSLSIAGLLLLAGLYLARRRRHSACATRNFS